MLQPYDPVQDFVALLMQALKMVGYQTTVGVVRATPEKHLLSKVIGNRKDCPTVELTVKLDKAKKGETQKARLLTYRAYLNQGTTRYNHSAQLSVRKILTFHLSATRDPMLLLNMLRAEENAVMSVIRYLKMAPEMDNKKRLTDADLIGALELVEHYAKPVLALAKK